MWSRTMGDGLLAAFGIAHAALAAAVQAQRSLLAETRSEIGSLRARMVLHTGPAEERERDYFGPALNRAARLMAAGHGGQVLLTQATYELVRHHGVPDITLRDLGERRLKDLIRPEHVYQLVTTGLPANFPPLKTLDLRPKQSASAAHELHRPRDSNGAGQGPAVGGKTTHGDRRRWHRQDAPRAAGGGR